MSVAASVAQPKGIITMSENIFKGGVLSGQLKEVRDRAAALFNMIGVYDMPIIDSLIPEINRLERICCALESIGVNLDETDIEALELLAKDPNYSEYRTELYEEFNKHTGHVQDTERDHEQDQATESLAAAGFVLDDEDGETWTKERTTVKIECIHPAESRYRWEYYNGHICEIGVSGEFHRLMALIGKTEVKQ